MVFFGYATCVVQGLLNNLLLAVYVLLQVFFFCILLLVSALACLVLEECLVTIMTIIDLFF